MQFYLYKRFLPFADMKRAEQHNFKEKKLSDSDYLDEIKKTC